MEQYSADSDWHWLRFPFLAEGDTPQKRADVRKYLAAHGYKIASVTMSFGDYMWNEPYARCIAKNDTAAIAQLESSYLEAASTDADFRRAMSKALYGHDIPYVLLMHVGAFDARMLPRLLKLYRDKGFTFISIQDAENDPFYASASILRCPIIPTVSKAQCRRAAFHCRLAQSKSDVNTSAAKSLGAFRVYQPRPRNAL